MTAPSIGEQTVRIGALTAACLLRTLINKGTNAQAARPSSPMPSADRMRLFSETRRGTAAGARGGNAWFKGGPSRGRGIFRGRLLRTVLGQALSSCSSSAEAGPSAMAISNSLITCSSMGGAEP